MSSKKRKKAVVFGGSGDAPSLASRSISRKLMVVVDLCCLADEAATFVNSERDVNEKLLISPPGLLAGVLKTRLL